MSKRIVQPYDVSGFEAYIQSLTDLSFHAYSVSCTEAAVQSGHSETLRKISDMIESLQFTAIPPAKWA